jgi:small subunit ribosomal protein S16
LLKIRLTRIGAKKQPYYRIVVAEERSRRDSRFVEILGHYNPRQANATGNATLDMNRVKHWLGKGAKPTDTVSSLIRKSSKQAAAVDQQAN